MKVYGEAVLTKFAKKHGASRRPLQRFLEIVRETDWPHFTARKQTFPATDLGKKTGKAIFDVGGNNYRLIAIIDFDEQALLIESVLTHEEYNREDL
ncbi:MAG: type II toxin-antitoxin system HigB family toxin [Bryobacteraceae bacterium]